VRRVTGELAAQNNELKRVLALAETQNLTLLYAAKSTTVNHVRVLLEVLSDL